MKCENKRKFWNAEEAKEAMEIKHKQGKDYISYYLCPECGAYHLTSQP
jgi:hypothetical protein